MRFVILLILGLTGIILVFYLSWLPQPKLSLIWFIPDWLAIWADSNNHNTMRTGVPFIFLGIFRGAWLILKSYTWLCWFTSLLGLISIVIIAEMGQLFLPYRSFDWYDIAWGTTGALIGLALALLSGSIFGTVKMQRVKQRRING